MHDLNYILHIVCIIILFTIITDVTINEFANNRSAVNRTKKSNIKTNEVTAKEVIDNTEIDAEDDVADCKSRRRSRKPIKNIDDDDDHVYTVHHIDIWFLISEHILPEDVGRFSQICLDTAYVCQTAKFWNHLYKRHYKPEVNMPVRLQPECMVRVGGLRTCTIRSLFYGYPLFVDRLAAFEQQDIFALVKRECVAAWVVQVKDSWHFCFKLKQKIVPGTRIAESEKIRHLNKFHKIFKDIYQNTEESCKILVVSKTKPIIVINTFFENYIIFR